ncbi:hypothetical protein [Chitinophaga barathri]|uniref:Uncharacterized protein n=1 Tax=Chitinophaga barathri TaxID=1647451 RepID=A0A3N4MBA3_9BACT|nr:hypothetical protein [Chitinophaga barathri]RPD38697.1 hypothetical protein EG028_23605 [Chitinophaga barathri]
MTDKEKLEKKAEEEAKKQGASIQPDPETLGPDPQEKMEGPVSSIVKNIAEAGDEEEMDEEDIDEAKDIEKREEKDKK